ncbi:MAG: paraquat-inducible protein A [Cocleimonas sp.]|nr:paraquat-inducible protein A [Cocleimonas sp.]
MNRNRLHHNQKNKSSNVRACPDCDLLQSIPLLLPNEFAYCLRCNATLLKNQKNSLNRSLSFAVTGLILFFIANLFPLITLKALSLTQNGTVLSTAWVLFEMDRPLLSLVMLFTTFIFPALTLLGTVYVLLQIKTNRINDYTAPLFRFLHHTHIWGMLEILMLAILVTVVKLGDLAEVIFGVSLYAFCLLILAMTLLDYYLNPHDIWNSIRQYNRESK